MTTPPQQPKSTRPSGAPLIDDVSAVLASGDGPWSALQIRGVLDLGALGVARVSTALWRLRRFGAARAVLRGWWVGPTSRWWQTEGLELTVGAFVVLVALIEAKQATTRALALHLGVSRWAVWSRMRLLEARRLVRKASPASARIAVWEPTERGCRCVRLLPVPVPSAVVETPPRLQVHERRARGVIIERPARTGALIGHIAPAHRDGERGWVVVRMQDGALDERARLETFRASRVEAEQVAELLWLATEDEEGEP